MFECLIKIGVRLDCYPQEWMLFTGDIQRHTLDQERGSGQGQDS